MKINNSENEKIKNNSEEENDNDDSCEGELFYGKNQNIYNLFQKLNNENKFLIAYNNKIETISQNDEILNLEKVLNTICKINPETIVFLFDYDLSLTKHNLLIKDKIGQIDFNPVIIRKFLPDTSEHENIEFYSKYFQIISKIAHPAIQIFYGILNKGEQKNNSNIEIILEYIPSDFDEVQIFIKKCLIGNNINYLIINKISEVLSFIYECGYPYLMLYPDNIKFDNKLFKQYFQVDEDSTYLYSVNKNFLSDPSKIFNNNFMKITNIGTYLKYKNPINKKYYSLKEQYLTDICYFSPELLKLILEEKTDFPEDLNILEKYDVYSFGCLLFYIFYQKHPYFYIINNKNKSKDENFKILIDTIFVEEDFLNIQMKHLESDGVKIDVPDEIIKLINACTSKEIELRPSFNSILEDLNNQIKELTNNISSNKYSSKDIFHDYSFCQLSKYNEDLIIAKEIMKNKKLKEELIDIEHEYKIEKTLFIKNNI